MKSLNISFNIQKLLESDQHVICHTVCDYNYCIVDLNFSKYIFDGYKC